ncbi:hypothetical protein [Arthrobacter sp. Marseille-P9274]|uniref:hypothetical protein n=1 Tax=Arthrobacter sp. Marseille-P9274 TaxID=2866572 RepID=UPI0021C65E53|nr:hypothetical protein [Arthrobacter sp. Marseille-P9274]
MMMERARWQQVKQLRVAAAVFAATVLMGVGAGAAAAKWSQSAAVEVTVAVGIVGSGCTVSEDGKAFTIRWMQSPGTGFTLAAVRLNNGGQEPGKDPITVVAPQPDASGLATLTISLDQLGLNNSNWKVVLTKTDSAGGTQPLTWTLSESGQKGVCS